ncbi:MAG: DMT family transporter [Puniceicoccales bacterium]
MKRPESQTSPIDGHRRGVLLMVLSIFLFAASSLIFKAAGDMPGVTGWVISLARGAVGLGIVVVFFWPRGQFQPTHLFTNKLLVLRGILGGGNLTLLYMTMLELGAGRAIVLNCMYPIFGSILAAIFLKEKLRGVQFFWMGLAFFGLTLITGIWEQGLDINGYYALGVLGAFVAGCVIVVIRHLSRSEHTATIFSAQCFYAVLVAIGPVAAHPQIPPPAALAVLVLGGILVSGGQLSMTRAYLYLPVAQGSSMQLSLPVVTALGAVVFLGEQFSLIEAFGAALIIVGCLQMVRLKHRG